MWHPNSTWPPDSHLQLLLWEAALPLWPPKKQERSAGPCSTTQTKGSCPHRLLVMASAKIHVPNDDSRLPLYYSQFPIEIWPKCIRSADPSGTTAQKMQLLPFWPFQDGVAHHQGARMDVQRAGPWCPLQPIPGHSTSTCMSPSVVNFSPMTVTCFPDKMNYPFSNMLILSTQEDTQLLSWWPQCLLMLSPLPVQP